MPNQEPALRRNKEITPIHMNAHLDENGKPYEVPTFSDVYRDRLESDREFRPPKEENN